MDKILHNGVFYTKDKIKEIVIAYYDTVFSRKRDRHVQMQKLFPNTLNRDASILDYGCGMGGVSALFYRRYGAKIDGVEISQNELEKAKITYGENKNINFILLEDFTFPPNHYDLVFSSQVIEHVHNPGNYLSNINKMLKNDGYLLIGLPNIVNIHYMTRLLFLTQKQARHHSIKMVNHYHKASDHINGWDPIHFITLLASCGFELVEYLPTEGTPIAMFLQRIPLIGKYLYNLPIQTNLSYTMFFLVKKVRDIEIGNYA